MRVGVSLPTVGLDHGAELLLPVVEAAERLGFDSVWATDHVLMPYERQSRYPYQQSGTEIAMTPGMQWLEPLSVLAFAAARSQRVRLGTSVLVLPYRNPVLLANEAATLHLLSGDRLILGVGAGWMREEFEALGLDAGARGARTDEGIEVLRTLWREDPASFEGEFSRFRDIVLAVTPREPAPPIWVGGNTRPSLRRALRLGDGWHGFEVFPEQMGEVTGTLAELGEELGRDPAELELSVVRGMVPPGREEESFVPGRRNLGDSAAGMVEELGAYAEAGVSLVVVQIALLAPLMPEAMEWFAGEVLPQLPSS
jgi:probable F420-dependent oxidoreductase